MPAKRDGRYNTAIRFPPELHDELARAAADRDLSINYLVVAAVRDFLPRLIPANEWSLTRQPPIVGTAEIPEPTITTTATVPCVVPAPAFALVPACPTWWEADQLCTGWAGPPDAFHACRYKANHDGPLHVCKCGYTHPVSS